MQPVKPDVDEMTGQQRHEMQGYDPRGIIVVASAWLLVYGLMFGAFAFKLAADVLASAH